MTSRVISRLSVGLAIITITIGLAAGGFSIWPAGPAQAQEVVLSELRTEIDTDPQALGYAGKSNFQIAGILNTVGLSGETIDVAFVSADVIQGAVVADEYLLLLSPQRDLWAAVLSAGNTNLGVPVKNANIRGQIISIWGPGTETRSNLAALQTRPGSRAEVLFGDGASVTDNQVEEAKLLP